MPQEPAAASAGREVGTSRELTHRLPVSVLTGLLSFFVFFFSFGAGKQIPRANKSKPPTPAPLIATMCKAERGTNRSVSPEFHRNVNTEGRSRRGRKGTVETKMLRRM